MKAQFEDDWLDARLREEAAYIDDAGFVARVIAQLPPPRPRRSFREMILFGMTLLASILAYFLSGGARFLLNAAERLAAMPFLLVTAALACALLMTLIATSAAFFKARERSLG